MLPVNEIICGDCLEVMAGFPTHQVDVVITDPPYGIGEARGKNKSRGNLATAQDYGTSAWDDAPPPPQAFSAMRRVSRHQVIFGGNYFAEWLPNSPSWIVWDKDNGTNDFADCELAWTSYNRAVRKIKWRWNGMLQENMGEKDVRFHPTQKPLGLMLWVVGNYSEPGDLILDPYSGSGTTCVAAKRLGRHYIGIEIDPDYCRKARARLRDTEKPLFVEDEPAKETAAELFAEQRE